MTAILVTLLAVAVVLTVVMFAVKQPMLGFPCVIFWALTGGQAYGMFVTAWVDIEYYIFFASFGMAIFTMMAAFSLRDKQKSPGEEEMEKEDGKFIDEDDKSEKNLDEIFGPDEQKVSRRTKEVRERAEDRRSGGSRKKRDR